MCEERGHRRACCGRKRGAVQRACDEQGAAHKRATRRRPLPAAGPWPAGPAGAVASYERRVDLLSSGSWADLACCDCGPPSPRLSRLASIAAHRHDYTWAARLRLAAQRGGQGRFCRTGGTWTCSAVFDRGAPGAAHTWSARLRVASSPQIPLPAVTVRVGSIARPEHARARDEQGTANTRATRQRPLPAVAGRGGRVVRVARGLARLVASATERVAARPR
jgi:hypothetical protein